MSFSIPGADGINMPAKLRGLVQPTRPDIKIQLHSRRKVYSTMDEIEGTVTITAPADTPFDAIEIEFVGTSRTYVERLTSAAAVSGRAEAFHQFLKLVQPGMQHSYPADRILRAGHPYDFPFVFVIPQQLLLRTCQHKVHNPLVRDAHLQLPPSFGDRDVTNRPGALDDMAPDMATVRYGVFARITKLRPGGESASYRTTLASRARKIRVIPAMEEQPPLNVNFEDGEYFLRKEKSIRKGMLKGKLGTLVMEAAQPQSLRLPSVNRSDHDGATPTTVATILLRFDPAEESCQPPRLGSLTSKLKVNTYFASHARHGFPCKTAALTDLSQGVRTESITLSSRCINNVEWVKRDPSKPHTLPRRDSACSVAAADPPAASDKYKHRAYYTARVLAPITLPTTKAFVPTFHSCLMSRNYALKLELGTQTSGLGGGAMDLRLPIQISAEAGPGDATPRRGSVDSGADQEIDADDATDLFEPRFVASMYGAEAGRGRIGSQAPVAPGDDAPPGYSPYVVPGARPPRRTSVAG